MNAIQTLLTDHIGIWTAADTTKKSGRGRSSGNAASVYGIRKLRELILELAVRGKLVPQDANDEPASELLKRIQTERAKLIAEAKIKKDKLFVAIKADEKPFDIPHKWEWVRLGEVLEMVNGRAFKPTEWISKGLPIVRIQNLNNSDAEFNYCDKESVDDRHIINNGSFLISWSGTPGTSFGAFIWNGGKAALNQHIFSCFQVGKPYFDQFLKLAINTRLEELISKAHGGVGLQHVTKGKLEALTLVLPSIDEQHRIVAKVDELMALCDQLETRHNNAAEAHEKLVSHLLGTLTQSQSAADFSANWQRIAAHFDTLFTTEASIDFLKQTLLQLAVMGKLVPQVPNDEPAGELLKRIQAEKAKLIGEGKIKKDKPLEMIADGENPFNLPQSWEWVHLQDLLDPSREISYGVIKLGTEPKTGGINTLRCSDVKPGFVDLSGVRKVSEEIEKEYVRTRLAGGEILLNIRGTLGGVALVELNLKGYNVAREVAVIPISHALSGKYMVSVMLSIYFWDAILDGLRGIAYKGLNLGALRLFTIPLPPISEQHRIVAKVDELMALCEQLKTRITAANHLQQKLADVVVEQAVV